MLSVRGLCAWYGQAQVLRGVDLDVEHGEVVTLVGRNGAGKTTLLRSLMGLHRKVTGSITLGDADITGASPHRRARLGLGYIPDDRGIYATLSVEEHLTMPPVVADDGWSMAKVYESFPVLRERASFPGTKLSGGEQQMLAFARSLRMGARLLLCDEPTEGLAPLLIDQIGETIRQVKAHGVTVLLIEQNLNFATTVADRHYILTEGSVVQQLSNDAVMDSEQQLLEHLGV